MTGTEDYVSIRFILSIYFPLETDAFFHPIVRFSSPSLVVSHSKSLDSTFQTPSPKTPDREDRTLVSTGRGLRALDADPVGLRAAGVPLGQPATPLSSGRSAAPPVLSISDFGREKRWVFQWVWPWVELSLSTWRCVEMLTPPWPVERAQKNEVFFYAGWTQT